MNYKIKTIILKGGDGFMPFDKSGVAFSYYSSYWLPIRTIRKIVRKLKLSFLYPIFYGLWKKNLNNTNLIIMFDAGIEDVDDLARFIKKKNSKIKIVFWYWNPVDNNKYVFNSECIDEIWTYNRFDARKYNLKYNSQFYPQVLMSRKSSNRQGASADIVFLGADKGRRQILDKLMIYAEKQGLKSSFTVIESKRDNVKYESYLDFVIDSKCIVDIVPNQFCGLTIRPLEALVMRKKLITNYKDIVNYDFYSKENIFIIGKDDIAKLADFVNSPYKKIDKKIVDFYSYESWLKRIERGEDIEP